jgi:hypothetical protein
MGQRQSSAQTQPQELEYYVIRLSAVQSVTLYGYIMAKTTLTWRDTIAHEVCILALDATKHVFIMFCVLCFVLSGYQHANVLSMLHRYD